MRLRYLAVAIAVAVAAGAPAASARTEAGAASNTLTVWLMTDAQGGAWADVVAAANRAFENAHPGVRVDVQIQTCEARGCYASLPIAPDLLATLRSGKQLKVSFQNLGKETITIPMQLTDFAAAYDKIK